MSENDKTSGPIVNAAGVPELPPLKTRSPILKHVRAAMITGLLTAIPLFITISILAILYKQVTKFTEGSALWIAQKLASTIAGNWVSEANLQLVMTPFLAVLMSLLLVYILGLLGTLFIGRKILAQLEHFISNLPLIKGIYGTTKQVMAV